jgi:hypothetical protein
MRIKFCAAIALLLTLSGVATAQLTERSAREIQLLINEKLNRNPAQKKMDSRLLQFSREKRGQKMVEGVNLEPVKVDADAQGNLLVDITGDISENLISKIESLGGRVIASSQKFGSARFEINAANAEKIAALQEVKFVEPAAIMSLESVSGIPLRNQKGLQKTVFKKLDFEERAKRIKNILFAYLEKLHRNAYFAGPVNSQGDRAHRADETRAAFGYAGQGIRIGLISDTYNALGGAPADIANGELPGIGNPLGNTIPVGVVQDVASGTDEGRAMMQIVHDLAPKAQLFFATANGGVANFANNILALRNAPNNCDIIIDDVSYSNEPVFYDGIIAQAVNTVTAGGAIYFSSAGNAGSLAKNTAGAYEADFTDTGSPVFAGSTKTGSVHNFGTAAAAVIGDSITTAGSFYSLHWADAPAGSGNDYDLFLISASGAVKASATNIQSGTQNPYEEISAPPALVAGDRLVVFKTAAAAVRAFHLNSQRGKLKYATNGQTHGHGSAQAAFSVAASPAARPSAAVTKPGPFPDAYSAANEVEAFSSDGPRKIFYNANGTPITPGNFLFGTNGGITRPKPDVTAADGVSTTIPGSLGNFYGTSAAAPHAGAIAGLLKSANPNLTPAQIRTILTTTGADIEGPGFDNVSGYGLLQAYQAMQAVSPVPQATVSLGTVSRQEGSFSNNNGSVDPGENGILKIQLSDFSTVSATGVVATLTTSTPGVSVVQGTSSYGTIAGGGSALNSNDFIFAINKSVACRTVVNFVLFVTYEGGASPQAYNFSTVIGTQPFGGEIVSVLGSEPVAGAGYTVVSGQQTGRLVRGSVASTCAVPIPFVGNTTTVGARQYDAYTFTNPNASSQCVTVVMSSSNGTNIYTAAYNDSGFVPTNPAIHYIAEPGPSDLTQTYSFNVDAGKSFTVVVHDVNVLPASNSTYRLNLSFSNCAAPPTCTPVDIVNTSLSVGATGDAYTQNISATGGSSNYSFSLLGVLPAGMQFSGNTLSGTPTQAGTFPLRIVAADLTGCPPDTADFTLQITGVAPAGIFILSGTPQTVLPLTNFTDSLKVEVRDASDNPLPGVKVIFAAPLTGASGTFAGGNDSVTLITNAAGIASTVFVSNAVQGAYTVNAIVNGVANAAFSLSNVCPGSFVVTNNADSGAGTLREILSNACAGSVVTFAPGISSIVLTSGQLVISKGVQIVGPGATRLVISGNNSSRIFRILNDTASVLISGITMRNGRPTTAEGGGAILVTGSTTTGIVTIQECLITSNDVSLAGNPLGGGIDIESGRVVINRSSVINNIATFRGGGIQTQPSVSLVISNSTIAGNTAGPTGIGGGIRANSAVTILNSTIFGNTAQTGGNISRISDSVNISNSIVAGGTLIGTGGSGPDLNGGGFKSGDYNFFQSVAGSGNIVGITTHNITGINPLLLPLGNYAGELPTILPQPSSAIINAGNPATTATTDQRGFTRTAAGLPDIGATEADYTIDSVSGGSQLTAVLSAFAAPLKINVKEHGSIYAGVRIIFSAPLTGQSGTFPNLSTRDTVVTDLTGVATSRSFTANNIIGTYRDTAILGAAFPSVTFELTNTISLPVVYGPVTASTADCITQINWQTLTETNSKDFTVEFSADGTNFRSLATMPAKGQSTSRQAYAYNHSSMVDGTSYYRIRQTDLNGAYTYSNLLMVNSVCGKQPVSLYPNPVRQTLNIVIPGSEKRTVRIFSASGMKVYQQVLPPGTHQVNTGNWITGIYNVSVREGSGKETLFKLIKD